MKKTNKNNSIIAILNTLLIILIVSAITFALKLKLTYSTSEIYYIEDLKTHDFILNDSTIINNSTKFYYTSAESRRYTNIYVFYYKTEEFYNKIVTDLNAPNSDYPSYSFYRSLINKSSEDELYQELLVKYGDNLESNYTATPFEKNYITIKKYSEIFQEDTEYNGWTIANYLDISDFSDLMTDPNPIIIIDLVPSNEIPNQKINDDYIITESCPANKTQTSIWYKYQTIDSYTINANNTNDNFFSITDGLYSFSVSEYPYSNSISFDFYADKGDIFHFEYLGHLSTGSAWRNISDIILNNESIGSLNSTNKYLEKKYSIETSGVQNLEFHFENDTISYDQIREYGNIKNLMLLTYINEGPQLDTSKVEEGDNIYVETICQNDCKLSSKFTYEQKEVSNEDKENNENNDSNDNEDIVNPPTKDIAIFVILIIAIISLFIAILTLKKHERKN